MKSRIKTPDDLTKIVTAFRQSRIILTAFELEVFTAIGAKEKSSAEVAKQLGADKRGLDRLLNALCALGLLGKEGGLFSNTPFSVRHLIKGNPEYLGGLAHTGELWQRWGTLTRAVKRGGTVLGGKRPKANEKRRVGGFIAAMHERASGQSAAIINLLDLSAVKKTLDIGGGSGQYSMALVRANKDIRATVFDLPDIIRLTQCYVEKSSLSARFSFRAGDFRRDDLGRGYNLALLSAIIHMNSPAENKKLFKKCAGALGPGGQLVVQDYIMNAERTEPEAGTLFALNMLINTRDGDTYTESEVRSWMAAAGFSKIRRRDTPFETSLIIGRKV